MPNPYEPEPEVDTPRGTKPTKMKIKTKLVMILLGLAVITGLTTYGLYKVNQFFNSNVIKFQSPVRLYKPIWVEDRVPPAHEGEVQAAVVETPAAPAPQVARETPPVPQPKLGIEKVVARVYMLESSGGKNDSCVKQGKFNGYGYAQSTFTWNCYATHAEVTGLVVKWFEQKMAAGMNLSTALCYYNTGHKVADCPYYQNFLKLK